MRTLELKKTFPKMHTATRFGTAWELIFGFGTWSSWQGWSGVCYRYNQTVLKMAYVTEIHNSFWEHQDKVGKEKIKEDQEEYNIVFQALLDRVRSLSITFPLFSIPFDLFLLILDY